MKDANDTNTNGTGDTAAGLCHILPFSSSLLLRLKRRLESHQIMTTFGTRERDKCFILLLVKEIWKTSQLRQKNSRSFRKAKLTVDDALSVDARS